MASRKLVIYQKNSDKPIVLTDKSSDGDIEDVKREVLDLMASKEIFSVQTEDDFLVIRPSEVAGILLSTNGEIKGKPIENPKKEENKETQEAKKLGEMDYSTELVITDE